MITRVSGPNLIMGTGDPPDPSTCLTGTLFYSPKKGLVVLALQADGQREPVWSPVVPERESATTLKTSGDGELTEPPDPSGYTIGTMWLSPTSGYMVLVMEDDVAVWKPAVMPELDPTRIPPLKIPSSTAAPKDPVQCDTAPSTFDFGNGDGPVPAHRHVNGGGWVANTAHVDNTAYVGPNARVLMFAKVLQKASVADCASVGGSALVSDTAHIDGKAVVEGVARVLDSAIVDDAAHVYGNARIRGRALVRDRAQVFEDAAVIDSAVVGGDASVCECARIRGDTLVGMDAFVGGYSQIDTGVVGGDRNDPPRHFTGEPEQMTKIPSSFGGTAMITSGVMLGGAGMSASNASSGARLDTAPSREHVATPMSATTTITTFDFGDGHGQVPAHQHANGGGWVADTAEVDYAAYVGPDARVYDNAMVRGRPRIEDHARVHGNSCVSNRSIVSGSAEVCGAACVEGDSRVEDRARVHGSATIQDRGVVKDDGEVYGEATISDDAIVCGSAHVYYRARLSNDAIAAGHSIVRGYSRIERGVIDGARDVNEPEDEGNMSEGQQESRMSKVTTELKANAKSAALRVAATQAVRAAREVFIATALKTIPKKERKVRTSITAVLRSEWGEPIIAGLLSLAIIATNPAAGSKRAILAAELRIMSMAAAANEAIASVAGPIFEMFAAGGKLDDILNQLPDPEDTTREEKPRVAEPVAIAK